MNRILRYISNDENNNIDTDDSDEDKNLDDYENSGSKYIFNDKWNIWYHHIKNSWKIDSFNNIYTITNIKDFWDFNNNIDYIGGINTHHYFMMRNETKPIWEDNNNKFGGCWSIKIPTEKAYELWVKLSTYLVGENITSEPNIVTGISICAKNPITSVVKIWNNDNKKNSIKLLPVDILNEYGFNIIYKSHIPEY